MSQNIQVIYENGVLRPLKPLDLPENIVFEVDLREADDTSAETMNAKAKRVLREAGLVSSIKFPTAEKISDEERRRIGRLFSGEKSLGDYVDEDREAR